MDKCALADITGIIGPHDGAACRNDALRGFRKLHIFAKRSTIEGDIGATIRRDIRYDGVTTIVGGDGVIVGQLDVIQAWGLNQYGGIGDVLTKRDPIGMSDNAAVGAIVYTLATAIVAVTGIDAAASTVIGCAHIAAVVFPVAVSLLQAPLQAVVIQRVTTDGDRLIGRPRITVG